MALNLTDPSWAPPGESSLDLFIERANLDGSQIGSISYGVFLTIWFMAAYHQVNGKKVRQVSWPIMLYLFAVLTCTTIFYAANTKWVEQMFIDFRNFHLSATPLPDGSYDPTDPHQSGPLGFFNLDYNTPMIVLGNSAYLILNFLADALVLYRCCLIWNFNYYVMIVPTLMFLGSTAMSILTVWNNSIPQAQFFGATSLAFATSWVTLSEGLNVLLTILIVGRLLHARARLVKVLGRQHARLYTSIAAMVVESAALTSTFSLLFLIFFRLKSNAAQAVNIILPLLTYAMAIAPTLILLRVAYGRAYSRETVVATTTGVTMRATPAPVSGTASRAPMVSLHTTSKGSRTQVDDEHSPGGWGIQKHEESVSSYV